MRRNAGVPGKVAIRSRARPSCSAASTSAERASDRCPALATKSAAFRSAQLRRSDAPAARADVRRSREIGFPAFPRFGRAAAPRFAQQRAVGRVLHQRVLEHVARMRRRALPEQQTGVDEPIERRMPTSSPDCAPLRRSARARTRARSPRRSAPPPWPARADRAAPSARHAGSPDRQRRMGPAAAVCRASLSLPASSTALVISSTNSGTPSVRSTMSVEISRGSALPPAMLVDHRRLSRRVSRSSVSGGHVRLSGPGRLEFRPERHDQQHAHRRRSARRRGPSSFAGSSDRPNAASSKIISTGAGRASVSICPMSACRRPLFRRCGGDSSSADSGRRRQRQQLGEQRHVLG